METKIALYQGILGEEFAGKYVKNSDPRELVFYKEGYEFLSEAQSCREIKRVKYMIPSASLCTTKDRIERDEDEMLFYKRLYVFGDDRIEHFQKLCQLHKEVFDFAQFEEVIGVKFYSDTDEIDLLHTSTGGITLDMLNEQKTPKNILEEIMDTHAKAMAELHKKGIAYTDPIPVNFTYDFKSKIICNPHNCIEFFSERSPVDSYDDAKELGALIYTHAYLPRWKQFVQKYIGELTESGEKWDEKRRRDFLGCVESHIAWAEEGGVEGLDQELQQRSKVIVRKNTTKPYKVSIQILTVP